MARNGRKRSISYRRLCTYARKHPLLHQSQIAARFGISQGSVSRILRLGGVTAGGPGKHHKNGVLKQHGRSDLEFKWELILHNAGLGLDRGKSKLDYGEYFSTDTKSATRCPVKEVPY